MGFSLISKTTCGAALFLLFLPIPPDLVERALRISSVKQCNLHQTLESCLLLFGTASPGDLDGPIILAFLKTLKTWVFGSGVDEPHAIEGEWCYVWGLSRSSANATRWLCTVTVLAG